MRTGFGYPSFIGQMTMIDQGGFRAVTPISNAADIIRIFPPAMATAAGTRNVYFALAAPQSVQFLALVNHNLAAGDTMRVQLFSDANPDPVGNFAHMIYDSGVISVWPGGGAPARNLNATRPHLLPAPLTIQSGRVQVGAAQQFAFGALEVAQWLELPGLGYNREFGLDDSSSTQAFVGGAEYQPDVITPRLINGQVDYWAISALTNLGIDFQKAVGQRQPFVWVEDIDDPLTWARRCVLVRNKSLPPMVGAIYRHDTFQLRLVEHIR